MFPVWGVGSPYSVVASDAALEGKRSSGGILFVSKRSRWALVADNLKEAETAWQRSEYIIAQLEMLMILLALLASPKSFRSCKTTWFIDNIPALWALVKGSANCEILNHMAYMIHSILFGLGGHMYFEYIESKSNWADELSRIGFRSTFTARHAFPVRAGGVYAWWWRVPLAAWPRIASFL